VKENPLMNSLIIPREVFTEIHAWYRERCFWVFRVNGVVSSTRSTNSEEIVDPSYLQGRILRGRDHERTKIFG